MSIRSQLLLAAGSVAAMLALAPAQAQETVKIGLILPMTGGQASTGKQIDADDNSGTDTGYSKLTFVAPIASRVSRTRLVTTILSVVAR